MLGHVSALFPIYLIKQNYLLEVDFISCFTPYANRLLVAPNFYGSKKLLKSWAKDVNLCGLVVHKQVYEIDPRFRRISFNFKRMLFLPVEHRTCNNI